MLLKRFKRLLAVFIAALFAVSAFGGLFVFKGRAVSAASDYSVFTETQLSIPNGQFNNSSGATSSGTWPKTPSDWMGAALNNSSTAKLYHGVISMDHNVYNDVKILDEQYKLGDGVEVPKNPFSDPHIYPALSKIDSGYHALMINTKDARAAYAYTSASLTLEANKCYEISVWVLTLAFSESGASVKLVDADTNLSIGTQANHEKGIDAELLAFRNIDTSEVTDTWREYTFNVQTYFTPMNIKVSLGVGDEAVERGVKTSGIAFFDNVTGRTISREDFEINAAKGERSNFISYSFLKEGLKRGEIGSDNTSYIKNGSFDSAPDKMEGWTWINGISDWNWGRTGARAPNHVGIKPSVADLSADKIASPFGKDEALRIRNDVTPSASGVISAPFTFQRYRFYRLSVWYRTLEGGQASIYLTTPNTDSDALIKANARKVLSSMTSLSSADNGDTENWQQAVFYIKGCPVYDIENVSLELWLGYGDFESTGTHSKGIAYFDMINIQYIDSGEYALHSASGTAVTLDTFAGASAVTNGNFSDIEYTDFDDFDLSPVGGTINYRPINPLAPASWTFVTGEDKSLNPAGLDFDFNDSAVTRGVVTGDETYSRVPAPSPSRRNVLTIRNSGKSAAGYSSPEIAVSPGGYQRISVWVSVRDGAMSFLQLTENGRPVATIEYDKKNPLQTGRWYLYSFIVWADADVSSLTLTLWNGWCSEESGNKEKNLSSGEVYFANVNSDTATADDYFAAVAEATTAKAKKTLVTSMAVDMVSNFGLFGNSGGLLKTPFRHNAAGTGGNVSSGILDTEVFTSDERDELGTGNPGVSKDGLRYVLAINNRTQTAFNYKSVKSQTLNASSYYRVTVSAQTAGISGHGAFISLAGLDRELEAERKEAVFSGFKTNDNETEITKETIGGTVIDVERPMIYREYKTYTFLIATGNNPLTFNYELGLGNVSRPTRTETAGYAFFDDMNVESISMAEFRGTSENIVNLIKLSYITSTEKAPGKTDREKGLWDWMWLPTVLLGLALLFVLGMVGVRKVAPAVGKYIQKYRKSQAASYDRSEIGKSAKPGKARKQASDGYENIVEVRTVKPEVTADEKAADGEAKADKPDAYTDYFED